MDQSNLNTGSQFSQPIRQIISLLIVAGLSGLGVVIAAPSVWPVFASNIYLNGAILFVFAIGVISCFAQVVQLVFSVRAPIYPEADQRRNRLARRRSRS